MSPTMPADRSQVVICRACVSECKEYKSLHKEGLILGEVTTLASLLTFCTNLDFDEQECGALPSIVCNNCIQDIAKSYLFKKKVLESDEALRSQLLDDDVAPAVKRAQTEFQQSKHGEDNQEVMHRTARGDKTENDLEELAAAAQMKRELEQHLFETQNEYDQISVLQADEDTEQIDEEQIEEHQIQDDDDMEYVVQEVAETTEIYHTTEIDHGHTAQQAEQMDEMDEMDDGEEVEYEIHVNDTEDEYNEIITDDPVEVVQSDVKRNFEDDTKSYDNYGGGVKKSRNRKTIKKEPNPNFQCQICNKQLSNSSSFKYHMQLHSDETPYKCTDCGERFKTRNAFDGHIRTHDPNNPNTCELCGKSYRQPSSLRIHMLSHTGEKPFTCNICNKSLTQKSGYKKHMLTHTGEKPYPCDICGKAFRISSNMLAHRRSHAGEKPYPCVICEKAFGSGEQLKRHMLVHSEEKPFTCNFCGKQFKRQSTLRSHEQSHETATTEVTNYDKKIAKSNVVEIM